MTDVTAAIEKCWKLGDLDSTEVALRELCDDEARTLEPTERCEILTQIARVRTLLGDCLGAHEILDDAACTVDTTGVHRASVRVALERGRAFKSSGNLQRAKSSFERAYSLAKSDPELEPLSLDALNMLGVIGNPAEQLDCGKKALALAEVSKNEKSRKWRGILMNNLGWTLLEQDQAKEALALFERDVEFRKSLGLERETRVARFSAASARRALGQVEEALDQQLRLLEEYEAAKQETGPVCEEIGECLWALERRSEAIPYFRRAYEDFQHDAWMREHETERLESIRARIEAQ